VQSRKRRRYKKSAINAAIGDATERGLRLFVVDPEGADVLDKSKNRPGVRGPQPLIEKQSPRVWGASRRPLKATINDDHVEHVKLARFPAL